jgi:ADP-ribose pyrophosphatase YjhB (NUDIX family)
VLEETGLQIAIGPVVEVFDRIDRSADGRVVYHFVVVDYACTVRGGELKPGSDAEDARWVAVEDLAQFRITDKATSVINRALDLTRRGV